MMEELEKLVGSAVTQTVLAVVALLVPVVASFLATRRLQRDLNFLVALRGAGLEPPPGFEQEVHRRAKALLDPRRRVSRVKLIWHPTVAVLFGYVTFANEEAWMPLRFVTGGVFAYLVVVLLLEIAFLRSPAFRNDWWIGRWFGKSRLRLAGDTIYWKSSDRMRLRQMDLDHGRLHPDYLKEEDKGWYSAYRRYLAGEIDKEAYLKIAHEALGEEPAEEKEEVEQPEGEVNPTQCK